MFIPQNLCARSLLFSLGLIALPLAGFADHDAPRTVYTMSNAVDGNRVLVFTRNEGGVLKSKGSYPTGGLGTGAALGSQGALAMTRDGDWLLAVNAASNEVSVFSVRDDVLVLTDVVPSGGKQPISVTVDANLVYVLNAGGAVGGADNITGFYLSDHGRLSALPGSTRSLSAANTGPAEISFALSGDQLVVTEKNTSMIDQFPVDDKGVAGAVHTAPSSGSTPFGFAVSPNGFLFVSEAAASALSSYQLHADASLSLVTGSLVNGQAAACWVALSKNGSYAYTANAASNTISGYRIAANGSLTLLSSNGLTAMADQHPLDLAVSDDGRFLYSLNANSQTIVGFRIGADGSLSRVSDAGGLPAGGGGLIAR
jgi:6-phosphogluconolactonase